MRFCVSFLVGLVLLVSPALAWNTHGHKIIASIAFRKLEANEQARVIAILKKHPRYAEDFAGQMPAEIAAGEARGQQEWLLQQAAVWPDIVRGFTGELSERYHHPTWHYVNQPHYLLSTDRAALEGKLHVNTALDPPATTEQEMNVLQTIGRARRVLKTPDASDTDKALMLCWLLHTIGDIHQPLHSTALFSEKLFPEGDRGGNLVRTKQSRNLHSLWDGFLGESNEFAAARNRALALLADSSSANVGAEAAEELDERKWLDESHQLAIAAAYDPALLAYLRLRAMAGEGADFPPLDCSEDYLKAGGRISERRVVQAGYRTAGVLRSLLAE